MLNIAIISSNKTMLHRIENAIMHSSNIFHLVLQIDMYPSLCTLSEGIMRGENYNIAFLYPEDNAIEVNPLTAEFLAQLHEINFAIISTNKLINCMLLKLDILEVIENENLEAEVSNYINRILLHLDNYSKKYYFKQGRSICQINKTEIIFMESKKRKIYLHATNNRLYCFYGMLKLEQKLFDYKTFIFPHASYLINLEYLTKYDADYLILCEQFTIPISEKKKGMVKCKILSIANNDI